MAWRGVLVGVVVAGLVTPALADVLASRFQTTGTCYSRHYDATHLRKNPRQRVVRITLARSGESADASESVLDFTFTLLDGGETYSAVAYCRDDVCSLEGDGGTFAVAPASNDGLRLSVMYDFLGLEGRNGWYGNLADSDDRVFLLYRARPGACEVLD